MPFTLHVLSCTNTCGRHIIVWMRETLTTIALNLSLKQLHTGKSCVFYPDTITNLEFGILKFTIAWIKLEIGENISMWFITKAILTITGSHGPQPIMTPLPWPLLHSIMSTMHDNTLYALWTLKWLLLWSRDFIWSAYQWDAKCNIIGT